MISKIKKYFIVFLWYFVFCPALSWAYQIKSDSITFQKIENLFLDPRFQSKDRALLIDFISQSFLNTPYQANHLIGSSTTPEQLVINFNTVDCLSFIEYVQALSLSRSPQDFKKNLIKTRYKNSQVDFLDRKHFFSDWFVLKPFNAQDVTTQIDPNAVRVIKHLNRKRDGSEYIQGLGVEVREIHYIPSFALTQKILNDLKMGDFVGIYSKLDGLDVSHVGIIIKKKGEVYFRNASSLAKNRKVVDMRLRDYLKNKPGIIILRPL